MYSVGALLSEIVLDPARDPNRRATGSLRDDLQPVIDRAMATEPGERHPDAQALLDDLDRAARRSFGPVWWTTEGLGAIAASAAGATLAASGTAAAGGVGAVAGSSAAAGSGGFGAVAGSMNLQGGGAVGGATGPIAGAAYSPAASRWRRGASAGRGIIAIVAGGAALVVVAVSAVALTRGDDTVTADPAPATQLPAVTAPPSGAPPPARPPPRPPLRPRRRSPTRPGTSTGSTATSRW